MKASAVRLLSGVGCLEGAEIKLGKGEGVAGEPEARMDGICVWGWGVSQECGCWWGRCGLPARSTGLLQRAG